MSIETVELSHLLISLAQSIKEGLGKEGEPHPNIPMAQYSLGMLHMVKNKTQGGRGRNTGDRGTAQAFPHWSSALRYSAGACRARRALLARSQ